MKNVARFTAAAVIAAGLGLAGLGAATEAQAQPGPFPQWCPGDFWDPLWVPNPDPWNCHDWIGPGPAPVDGEALEGGGLTGDLAVRRRPADRDGTPADLAAPGDQDGTLEDPRGLDLILAAPGDLDLTQGVPRGLAEGAIVSTTVSAE